MSQEMQSIPGVKGQPSRWAPWEKTSSLPAVFIAVGDSGTPAAVLSAAKPRMALRWEGLRVLNQPAITLPLPSNPDYTESEFPLLFPKHVPASGPDENPPLHSSVGASKKVHEKTCFISTKEYQKT